MREPRLAEAAPDAPPSGASARAVLCLAPENIPMKPANSRQTGSDSRTATGDVTDIARRRHEALSNGKLFLCR